MKNKITLLTLVFTLISFVGYSQKTVNAEDIIRDIKNGKDISISNATIEGTLDFTDIKYFFRQTQNKTK